MGNFNKHQNDRDRFGKCEICLRHIPIEYYFSKGDTIICYECGTEYILTEKNPVRLSMAEGGFDPDSYYGDTLFND